MDALSLAEGSIFVGRYRIVRQIAQGGMGAVYEVEHTETARHRALKVMLPNLLESDELRERFRLEARVAAQIESAYIVDVFDAGIDDASNVPFLVMELLRGEELGKRLKRLGRFMYEEAVGYLWQTALALDKTHRAHIVHRDLKPENLFLAEQDDEPPRIKVLDFGVAKFVAEQGTAAQATRSIGTPLYMAPEQFRSGSKVSPATDMYALGMMAYTFLVGKPYWLEEQRIGGNLYAFMGAVMFGPTESATFRAQRLGVELPPGFDAWFDKMTAQEPGERFPSATLAITRLAQVLSVSTPISPSNRHGHGTQESSLRYSLGDTNSVTRPLERPSTRHTDLLQVPSVPERCTVSIHSATPLIAPTEHSTGFGLSASQPNVPSSDPAASQSMTATAMVALQKRRRVNPTWITGVAVLVVGIGAAGFITKSNDPARGTGPMNTAPAARVIPDPPIFSITLSPPGMLQSAEAPLVPKESPKKFPRLATNSTASAVPGPPASSVQDVEPRNDAPPKPRVTRTKAANKTEFDDLVND